MNKALEAMEIPAFGESRLHWEDERAGISNPDTSAEVAGGMEEVAAIVQQIFLTGTAEPPKTVMFSAVEQGSGCSLLARETAALLARYSGSVCLLEANFRSPSLAKAFGVMSRTGLADILDTDDSIAQVARPVAGYPEGRFSVVPAGLSSPGASVQLTPDRLKARLRELETSFRYVIVDAPPVSCLETLPLAKLTSGLVMVLEAGRTRRDAAAAAAAKVKTANVRLLGAVLNKRTFAMPAGLYNRL